MRPDLEHELRRELRAVAEAVPVPPLPSTRPEPTRALDRWQPLLVAAVVLAIGVAGVLAVRAGSPDEVQPAPAPATPSVPPEPPNLPTAIARTATGVPHVVERRLHVDGQQVPGEWFYVLVGAEAWVGGRADGSWVWSTGTELTGLTGLADVPPAISPDGAHLAVLRAERDLMLLATASGEEVGRVRLGADVNRLLVTDEGEVVVQGQRTAQLWSPLAPDAPLVDLTETLAGRVVTGTTPAGPVVMNGDGSAPFLADLESDGAVRTIGALPDHDDLVVSPGSEALAWTPQGSSGGEAVAVPSLRAQRFGDTGVTTLLPPAGWDFRVFGFEWEDDQHLVATVVADDSAQERVVRCRVEVERCVLVEDSA